MVGDLITLCFPGDAGTILPRWQHQHLQFGLMISRLENATNKDFIREQRVEQGCLPPVRLLPGYPAGLSGRVLPTTGSGSDPKPAGLFGLGTRVPG